jgi:hypothetical protein
MTKFKSMRRSAFCLLALIVASHNIVAGQTRDQRVAPWAGCYELAVQDSAGAPFRAYGTVSLLAEPIPTRSQRAVVMSAIYVKGGPHSSHQTQWHLTATDTLVVSSWLMDGGFFFRLTKASPDSLLGVFETVEMVRLSKTQAAVARKRPSCS